MNKFWTSIASISLTINAIVILAVMFALGGNYAVVQVNYGQSASSETKPVELSQRASDDELLDAMIEASRHRK